ncbi:hypothetical protein LTR56_024096 [Elasticomyces elasticus]|nr:hypothetical protein LTR56_024096 [Elasticomyces elasticus]
MDIAVECDVLTLPQATTAAIESLPDMRKLLAEREQLRQSEKGVDGDLSDGIGHSGCRKRRLANRIRSLRAYHCTRAPGKLCQQYLEHKNDAVIEALVGQGGDRV